MKKIYKDCPAGHYAIEAETVFGIPLCLECCFYDNDVCFAYATDSVDIVLCCGDNRSDNKDVIFKKIQDENIQEKLH